MSQLSKAIAFAAVLLAAPALAQQPSPPSPPSPTEQALTQRLMQEIGNGINCNVSTITLQRQLADAQAQVKQLEAKVADLTAKIPPK